MRHTQHTLGLYVAVADRVRGQEPRIKENMPAIRTKDGGKEVAIITAHGKACEHFKPGQYANLFAAAPELLKALECLLKCPDLNLDDLEHETKQALEQAMNARAKARGQV